MNSKTMPAARFEAIPGWLTTRTRAGAFLLSAAMILATAVGAQIAIPLPFTPVPVTLQTLFVLLAGVVLGPRVGFVAMVAYVLLGAAGLPVFAAGKAGVPVLVGPTGGYLLGFPFAAAVAGWLAAERKSWARLIMAWLGGTGVVFLFGVAQLAVVTGSDLSTAARLGMTPFLPGAVLKAFVGIALTLRFGKPRSETAPPVS